MDAREAYERLQEGNARFLKLSANEGNIAPDLREQLATEGQRPFAVVIACSDSRVVPEHVFNCGLGEIFTIRTAGNTVGSHEVASAVYACGHLGCKLVVVLGHTQCGAVGAALGGGAHGAVGVLTDAIRSAIGDESDPAAASIKNVERGVSALGAHPEMAELVADGLQICGALHHIESGRVEFLSNLR